MRGAYTDGLRRGLVRPDLVDECLTVLGSFPGCRAVRRVRAESEAISVTRSEIERLFQRVSLRGGVSPTAMNHRVVDASGNVRYIDAAYLPERLPIELDSRTWHRLTLDRRDDRRRENAIVLTGWRSFLRYDWWDLTEEPDRVCAEIRAALEAARRESAPGCGDRSR